MAARSFAFLSYVRIDANNKSFVYYDGSGTTQRTVTLTEGVYPFGFGQSNPDGAADSTSFGVTSFLEHLQTQVQAAHANLSAVEFGLQTEYTNSEFTASATGHVWVKPAHADDEIRWSVGTVHRAWFGIAPGTSTSALTTGGTWEDISDFASSLAFVGQRSIHDDRPRRTIRGSGRKADSGKAWWQHHGKDTGFFLGCRVYGIPRADEDSEYHSLRRWIEQLHEAQASRRFYYVPDLSPSVFGTAYDIDGTTDAKRYGYSLLQLDPTEPTLEWDDEPMTPGVAQHWLKRFKVQDYVS